MAMTADHVYVPMMYHRDHHQHSADLLVHAASCQTGTFNMLSQVYPISTSTHLYSLLQIALS